MCTDCWQDLNDYQLMQNWCSYCGTRWEEYDNFFIKYIATSTLKDDTYFQLKNGAYIVQCESCDYEINFGELSCPRCHLDYDKEYWTGYMEDLLDDVDPEPITTQPQSMADLTLCCDNPWVFCECEDVLTWEDSHYITQEEYEEAYAYNSPCSECAHYYTEDCLPFRHWMREALINGTIELGSITDLCDNYVSYVDYNIQMATLTQNASFN